MTKYKVYLRGYQNAGIIIEAADPDAAIEEALNEGIPEICGHCSGWGQGWWREEGEEWTPESVTDPAGDQVWAGPSAVDDAIIRELSWLRSEIKKSSADTTARCTIMRMIDTRLARLRSA